MRLLIVTPKYPPQIGGAARVFCLLANGLKKKSVNVYVLANSSCGFIKKDCSDGIEVFRPFPYFEKIRKKLFFLPLAFFLVFIYFLANRRKFDAVETHTAGELCLLSQIMAKAFGKRLIKHVLDMSNPSFLLRHPMPDAFVCCGETIKKRLMSIGIPEGIIHDINLPVEIVENNSFKKGGKKVLMFVGEISAHKGVDDILSAMKKIRDDFELWFVGSGPLESRVKKCSKADKRIKFFGVLDSRKITDLFRKTDALIHPSYSDVMPLSILDAMMMGNAIIATDIGEIKKNVMDAGIIIKPGDIDALVKAFKTAIKKDMSGMKKNAIKNFRKYAGTDVIGENLRAIEG